MGAWSFVVRNLRERLGIEARTVARPESPSPATGRSSGSWQQEELLERALPEPAPSSREVEA